jgi:hypothetical protein
MRLKDWTRLSGLTHLTLRCSGDDHAHTLLAMLPRMTTLRSLVLTCWWPWAAGGRRSCSPPSDCNIVWNNYPQAIKDASALVALALRVNSWLVECARSLSRLGCSRMEATETCAISSYKSALTQLHHVAVYCVVQAARQHL